MYVPMLLPHVYGCLEEARREPRTPMELEFQAVENHLTWVPGGIQAVCSADSALNC